MARRGVLLLVGLVLAAGCADPIGTLGLDAQRPPPCEEDPVTPPRLLVDDAEGISIHRWSTQDEVFESIARTDGLADPVWAHGRIYATGEEAVVAVNETLEEVARSAAKRPAALASTGDGLLVATNGSVVSLGPDLERLDRLGPQELIGVDMRKDVHAIHARDGTAWMLDNTVQPVWIIRADATELGNLSVDARHHLETFNGHLSFHWLDQDEGAWRVVETSFETEIGWRKQTVHTFEARNVTLIDSTETWFREGNSEEGRSLEAVSPGTAPWALLQRGGDVGVARIGLEEGELVDENLTLLASEAGDRASALAVEEHRAAAAVGDRLSLVDLQGPCLLAEQTLGSPVDSVTLIPNGTAASR